MTVRPKYASPQLPAFNLCLKIGLHFTDHFKKTALSSSTSKFQMTFYISSLAIASCFAGLFCQNVVDVAVSLGLNKLAQAINDTGFYEEWATDGNNLFFKY